MAALDRDRPLLAGPLAPPDPHLPAGRRNWPIAGSSWTAAEIALPYAARHLLFIFSSVYKQMKSFFFSGLFYAALSVQRHRAALRR